MRGWFSVAEDIQLIFLSFQKGEIPFEFTIQTHLPSTQPSCPFSKMIHQTPTRGKHIFGKAVLISEGNVQNIHCLIQQASKSEFTSDPAQAGSKCRGMIGTSLALLGCLAVLYKKHSPGLTEEAMQSLQHWLSCMWGGMQGSKPGFQVIQQYSHHQRLLPPSLPPMQRVVLTPKSWSLCQLHYR